MHTGAWGEEKKNGRWATDVGSGQIFPTGGKKSLPLLPLPRLIILKLIKLNMTYLLKCISSPCFP